MMQAKNRGARQASPPSSPATDESIMPPDRSRTANSQGRQKSCSECAKAKRKCGLEQPHCARCARQHFSCVYPPQPRSQAPIPQASTSATPTDLSPSNAPMDMLETDDGGLTFDFDLPAMPTDSAADILDFDFCTATSSLDALTDMLNTPAPQEDQGTIQKSFIPLKQPFSSRHLSPFAKSRVEYSIELVKLAPKMMVEQCCTPWAHPLLYEDHMPRSLQDAHAACALYITMNDNNAEHVARFITSRAEELITTAIPTTPIEILARTQALMLYEIMLIFGGDIRLYARADALIPHLEDVGVVLLPIAAEDPELPATLPLYPSTAARSAWKSYIFRESARRTALVAFHITVIYTLLSGQMRSCAKELSLKNRVTLSAHLWKASSAFDFAIAWNSKSHFVIKELDFTDVLRGAQPDDLDAFANMMLIGLQGIDDIRGWYHTRGGALT